MIEIAVIMSVYREDNPTYLDFSIRSMLNQTYPNCKIFIGVDGPISNELATCLYYYKKHEKIRIIFFQENRGLAKVLNDLLNYCRAEKFEYFARMDADDISLPDRIEKQIKFLENNPDIDVVGGSILEIDECGISRNKVITYPSTPNQCKEFFARRNPLAHPAVMFRLSFFQKTGCQYRPDYKQNQDTLLWYDGLMKGVQIANIPDVILHFRMTNALFRKRRNGFNFAKKQLKDRLMINMDLEYGLSSNIFAILMFFLMISPTWVKKIAYKFFR